MRRAPWDETLERGTREHYEDAVYYDHVYRRRREDVEFYRAQARRHGGPVLELGVGSGRVAVPLALDGHAVVGIDRSAAMLARARARARVTPPGRLELRRGDLRGFRLGRRFPLVIAPFNALLHLYEPQDFARCFAAVRRHLSPGGRFVFDVRVPNPVELARRPEREYAGGSFVHPTLGERVRYTESFFYDPIKQVQYVTMRFYRGGRRGVVEVLLTHRQVFPAELRGLLALGGLKLVGRYGDFTGRALEPGDELEVVVACAARDPR